MTSFWFVRHGESLLGTQGYMCGSTDTPLTTLGHTQARTAATFLEPEPATWLVSSPLIRCIDTARPITEITGLPLEVDDRLAEHHKGVLEGRPFAERPTDSRAWEHITGAESMPAFYARTLPVFADLATRDGVGIVVAHGGIARVLRCAMQQSDPNELFALPLVDNAAPFYVTLPAHIA